MQETQQIILARIHLLPFILTLFVLWSLPSTVHAKPITPEELRCESVKNPLGIDSHRPGLSWQCQSTERNKKQTAYQILVASSLDLLKKNKSDLWDSGKVQSDQTTCIPYEGQELTSSQQVFWKVRLWDETGRVSKWSPLASWTMGILNESEWQADWIGNKIGLMDKTSSNDDHASLLLRKEFPVQPKLTRAVIHTCGLGQYEMTVNGQPVTKDLLSPGWTMYNRTCLYDTYEITPLLQKGENVVGLFLGHGMYNSTGGRYTKFIGSFGPLTAITHLRLEYSDGSVQIIGSDQSWRAHAGPITFSCVYGGEDYDTRLEQPGWDQPGFDDSNWNSVLVTKGPGGTLKGQSTSAYPLGSFEIFKPININPIRPDTTVYDLGQNASMMPRLKIKGPSGSSVIITPSELIHEDGTVDRSSCGGGEAYWKITLDGRESLDWFPKFFYVGCRYLQVQCIPAEEGGPLPVIEQLEGVVVHSTAQPVGQFTCSNELFNRIHTLIRWAQRSNMVSVLTDCPHREKLGWLEQSFLNGPALRYEFDLNKLFSKILNDISDSQLDNGLVPDIAPEYVVFNGGFRDSPEWGSAVIIVPWQQYEWTGSPDLLRRYYDNMKRYLEYLGSKSTNHIVSHGLGDWYDIGPKPPGYAQLTPISLTATAFYFYDAQILAKAASLLGYKEDAEEFAKLAEEIRIAFNKEFYNEDAQCYSTNSQCANAIPLFMGIVEPEHLTPVFNALVKDVENKDYITGGDVGYPYILMTLANHGRSDLIYGMTNQSDRPGYGYILAQGATSLTESWVARRTSSQNHFMLGHINEWFYSHLAGIQYDRNELGFKRILIKPEPVADLTWAKGVYNSIRGKIVSDWKIQGNTFYLNVEIPANTTACVSVPSTSLRTVLMNGNSIEKSKDIISYKIEKDTLIAEIGSGIYRFQSELDQE